VTFIQRWLVNTFSLLIVTLLLPGVNLETDFLSVILVALLIGVINSLLRPILYFAGCGLIILTAGLAIPVINALLLLLADELAGDAFNIDGFGWAILAAIIMGIVNMVVGFATADDSEDEEGVRVIRF